MSAIDKAKQKRIRMRLLRKIDNEATTYSEKLLILNNAFLKAKTPDTELVILGMIRDLKFIGS